MATQSPVGSFTLSNYLTQSGTAYPLNIDACLAVAARIVSAFAPQPTSPVGMSLVVAAGHGFPGGTFSEIAAQTVTIGTAPSSNSRIDRVVIAAGTGVASVIAGTVAASPMPSALPSGYLPVAQVTVAAGTTAISASMIADERDVAALGIAPGSLTNARLAFDGGALGFRNRIINGAMQVDQRNAGALVSVPAGTATYIADRWRVLGTGATQSAQRVSISSLAGFNYAMQVTGAAGATDITMSQNIEQLNVQDLVGQTITASCWIYANTAGSVTVQAKSANAADIFSATTQIATSTLALPNSTWTKLTFTFAANANVANGLQLNFDFGALGVGASRMTTGVQLEAGASATAFEYRDIGDVLRQCQRYFNKIAYAATGWAISASGVRCGYTFPLMRATPTFVGDYGSSVIYGPGGQQAASSPTVNNMSVTAIDFTFTAATGGLTINASTMVIGTHGLSAEL